MESCFVPTKLALLLLIQALSAGLVSTIRLSTVNIDVGCFSTSQTSDLRSSPGNYDQTQLIPYTCATLCTDHGTKLAGVTKGDICVCGNTMNTSSPNGSCDQTCTGDSGISCGGETDFNVYNITGLGDSPEVEFQTEPVLFETVLFQVGFINRTWTAYHLTYEYTGILNEKTALSFGNTYNYTFTAWGDNVQMLVIVVYPLWQEFKITVPVRAPLKVSSPHCPYYVLTNVEFECSGRLDLGKQVNVTWHFGGISSTMPLADPVSLHVCSPVPRWTVETNISATNLPNGLVICLTCTVTQPVIIHAWEMNVNRSGTVDLVILRPSCSNGSAYSPITDACSLFNIEFSSELCNQNNSFCGSTSICKNSTATCGSNKIAGQMLLTKSYSVVYNVTIDAQEGYNLKLLPSNGIFEYVPGDIIGWIKTNNRGILSIDPTSGRYNVLVSLTSVSLNSTIVLTSQQQYDANVGTVLLAGVASRSVNFLSNITAPGSIGTHNVTFVHETLSGETLMKTSSVFALNPIGNISLNTATNSCFIYGALNETFNVSLHISAGTMPSIIWNVANTTKKMMLKFGTQEKVDVRQNFTLSEVGVYFLSVMVSNPQSGQLIHSQIIIQEKITGLSAEPTPNTDIFHGIEREFTASVMTGTNVTFKWYFGDGSRASEVSTQGTIVHAYLIEGLVNTTVEASNMVSSVNFSMLLNVSNPVEMSLPVYGVNGSLVNLTCRLPDDFTEAYMVVFLMDNSSMISSNCNTIQYTFSSGIYHITCTIKLGPVILRQNGTLFVLEPITGLKIQGLPPTKVGETRLVESNITTGNNVSYSWEALEQSYDTYQTSTMSFNFSTLGKIKISVNASNAISEKHAEVHVIVQEPIGALMVNTSSNPGQANSVISFSINKTSGTEVNYTVNISDRSYFQDLGASDSFTYSFVEGIHEILVCGRNYISQSNVTYQITIQDPLVYPINISCPGVWDENGVCVLKRNSSLQFNAKAKYATNVSFTWSWDSTGKNTSSDENPSNVKPYVVSTANRSFNQPETYNVSVFAENQISHAGTWIKVFPLDLITGFSFSAPKAVPIDEIFRVNIAPLTSGSNVTFWFDAGDSRARMNTSRLDVEWIYTITGIFPISGIAKNLLSNETVSHSVAVQEKVISIKFLNDIPVVEVASEILVKWEVRGGTNVSTLVVWGDGTQSDVYNKTLCVVVEAKVYNYTCVGSHSFAQAGSYKVNVTAYNLLSTRVNVSRTITIEDSIEGLRIDANNTAAYVYTDSILITVGIDKGSSVLYTIDTGDGRKFNTSETTIIIKYKKANNYKLSVVATNKISQKHATAAKNITVVVPVHHVKITGLRLKAEPAVIGTETKLLVSYTTGAKFKCVVKYGDGEYETLNEKKINQPIGYTYSKIGDYVAEISCWNIGTGGTVHANTMVSVHERIQQFHCLNSSDITKDFPTEFSIYFSWENGSHVEIVAYTKSDKPNVKESKPQKPDRKSGYLFFPSDYFASPGYHTIYIYASNAISFAQTNISLHLIESIAGLRLLVNPYVSANFSLVAYLVLDKGSELMVTWNFGDGTDLRTSNCTWRETCSQAYVYNNVGKYIITANARNDVSCDASNATVTIQNPIFNWKFSAMNISEYNSSSFMNLIYDPKFPFPTDASYLIKYGDEAQTTKKNLPFGRCTVFIDTHKYGKSGCYEAKVTIKNLVSVVVLRTEIEVRGKIDVPMLISKSVREGNLSSRILPIEYPVNFSSNIVSDCLKYNWTITDGNQTLHVNHSVNFIYSFKSVGTYNVSLTAYDDKTAKFATKFVQIDRSVTGLFLSSDGIAKVNDTVNFVLLCASLGNKTYFVVDFGYSKNDPKTILLPVKNISEDFRNTYEKLNVPFNPIGFYGVIFNHTYTSNNTYVVTVETRKSLINHSLTNQVVVDKAPCPLPNIKIVGGSPHFKSAPDIPYKVQYTFFSEVKTDCEGEVNIDFSWSVFKADIHLLERIGISLPPEENMRYPLRSKIRTNQSSLTIPRKAIYPGLYIFKLSISFPDFNADTNYISYLRIQRPPLTVLIAGGSSRSIPWNKRFILDATLTVDPLSPSSTDHLKYEWRCTQKENPVIGGCFGGGKLLSVYEDNKTAVFREKLLMEKINYQFTVTVSTEWGGKTSGSYTQEIQAIPGNPPILSLSCVSNCAPMLNPDSRLSIESTCSNCDGNEKYQWLLENSTSSDTTAYIWTNNTFTKIDAPSLVVKAGTFKLKHIYNLQLRVTNEDHKTGFVSYKVMVNSPPHGGKCEFLPKQGVAMETNFNFTCRNWLDDQINSRQPLTYKLLYTSPVDRDYNFLVYHGPKATIDKILLPSGLESNNHTYTITVRVEDIFGAYVESTFSVKVEPDKSDTGNDLEKFMNSSIRLRKLVGSGDLQGANRLAISLMTEVKSVYSNATEETNQMFYDIVKTVADNFPNDLNSMRQSIETVVIAVDSDNEVLPETQIVAINTFLRTSEMLISEAKEDIGNDIVEDIAYGLFTGIGNIMKSSSLTQSRVHQLDVENITLTKKDKHDLSDKVTEKTGVTESLQTIKEGLRAISIVSSSILEKKVKEENRVLIETKNLQAYVLRTNSAGMNGSNVSFSSDNMAAFEFPEQFSSKNLQKDLDTVDVMGLYLSTNPYVSQNNSNRVDSSAVSIELKSSGSIVVVEDLDYPLKIDVPREKSKKLEISENMTETKLSELIVYILNLSDLNNAFVIDITPERQDVNISLYFRDSAAPTLTTYEFNETLVPVESSCSNCTSPRRYFLRNNFINNKTSYLGVGSRMNGKAVMVNYTFRSYEVGCYYWDENEKVWTTTGCHPDGATETLVTCLCSHATLFGSNFFVAPNVINVEKEILNLAKLGEYPALLATICVILGLYIIAMVWAKRKDRREAGKTSLHVSVDNDPYHTQRYEVTVLTGSRRNAGSTAEVSLIISGDQGDSESCLLQRTSSVSYQRSSQDSYLVTTSRSLGSLLYIRIWHDTSGSNPSWFLSEIIIRDVETGDQYFFLCNNWLACDEGDGLVERLIPVASAEELKDFQYLFTQNSTQGFSDGHLWFSIVLRPAQSRFTHAQRVSCCLCLLLCTMLTNAMFYQVEVKKENNVDVDVGPYEFTWHEVMVGIQSSFIVFPVNLLIVNIFRRIASRPRKSSKYLANRSTLSLKSSKVGVSLRDIELEKNRRQVQETNERDQLPEIRTTTGGKKMWLFPWWFIYVGWFILICVTLTAAFFTLLYGISFGKKKQEKWLTALVISVFQDVLISQPIKIFAISLFVAFVIRKPNNGEVNEENDELLKDKEWIQESLLQANPNGIARTKSERKPPDELILRKIRLSREKERKMFQVFREVIHYFFFWWVVLMIAYGYREPDAHRLTTAMEQTFVQLGQENDNFSFKRTSINDLYKTKNKRDLMMWLHDIVIPGLNHETWYNNKTDHKKNFIADAVGYLVGHSRLRLLRVRKDTCKVTDEFEDIVNGCESEYSYSKEYQAKNNRKHWIPTNESLRENEEDELWQYKSQSELYERPFIGDLASYRGGGYVLKLKKGKAEGQQQIKKLNQTWWIDGQTRAVFVEFTVFNPNKNLHCIVTIIFECPASGGCAARYQILSTRLDELIGNYRLFVLALELIFILFMVSFTYKTIKRMIKQGIIFWKMFWNWIEMGIVAVGWSTFSFYILRFIANKWTKSKFHDEEGNFVSFRYVATADQLYGIVLAFIVFLTTVKFLRLFRFNRRMSLLGSTLKYASWDLLNFGLLFFIAFTACACVAYLLFHNDIDMFSSMLVTTQTLMNIILGKFKYMNLSQEKFVASAVVLFVYVVIVVFILINVFLVILNDAFQVVKRDNDLQENEHEIVDYITGRFKSWIGIKTKPSKLKSDFEHEYGFRPTYVCSGDKPKVPPTVVLDRKVQELLDFVDKQAQFEILEDLRLRECEDKDAKKKAILLLMI